jgi:uncharacterized SAM-binding protein YcdF (DUF218 family)
MKKHWGHLLCLIALAALGYGAVSGFFWNAAESWLVRIDAPQKSDLIVVLSGSSVQDRLNQAAQLYHEGFAPKVLLSGHMVLEQETGISLMETYLIQLGVPKMFIEREGHSETTWQNVEELAKIVKRDHVQSVLAVTSAQHTRRTRVLLQKALPSSVRILVNAKELEPVRGSWFQEEERARFVIHEYLSFLWGMLYGFQESVES